MHTWQVQWGCGDVRRVPALIFPGMSPLSLMTPELWAQLIGGTATFLVGLGAWLQSRRTAAKAEEAKQAAENGTHEREALRERAEKAEQSLAAMTLQRDTFRDIVRFVKSRPEAVPALRDYQEKRQVAVRDPALDALLAAPAAPGPSVPASPALPADWRPWAVAGSLALGALALLEWLRR